MKTIFFLAMGIAVGIIGVLSMAIVEPTISRLFGFDYQRDFYIRLGTMGLVLFLAGLGGLICLLFAVNMIMIGKK